MSKPGEKREASFDGEAPAGESATYFAPAVRLKGAIQYEGTRDSGNALLALVGPKARVVSDYRLDKFFQFTVRDGASEPIFNIDHGQWLWAFEDGGIAVRYEPPPRVTRTEVRVTGGDHEPDSHMSYVVAPRVPDPCHCGRAYSEHRGTGPEIRLERDHLSDGTALPWRTVAVGDAAG